jgi:ribosomal protein L7/L12
MTHDDFSYMDRLHMLLDAIRDDDTHQQEQCLEYLRDHIHEVCTTLQELTSPHGYQYPKIIPHCAHCGRFEAEHVNTQCLFQSTYFQACSNEFSVAELDNMRAGKRIPAIKLYRARMGLGLKESKDVIDAEILKHRW